MCLAGLHYCFFREEHPSSSQKPVQAQNAPESPKTAPSSLVARQVEQMSPSEPRVRSDHNVWASIRLFSRRVAQNLMALMHTGRLRSTVIENFKTSLKKESSEAGELAWQCKIYESCCMLLDIGCKPDVVMRELENTLPADEYKALNKNFADYKEALNKEGSKAAVAKELLRAAFVRYCLSCLKGEILSSHSMLKHIEKLLAHVQNDGIDIDHIGGGAWKDAGRDIAREVVESSKKFSALNEKRQKYQLSQVETLKDVRDRLGSLRKSVKSRKAGEIKNEKMVNNPSIKTAEETLKKLAQPKNDESELVQQVAIMNKLILLDLREVGMQIVLDKYIDQIFDSKDFESYRALCGVVRLFDDKPELRDGGRFIRLLSTRLQEKNKVRLNSDSKSLVWFIPHDSSQGFAHEL